MQLDPETTAGEVFQEGLSKPMVEQGYFLACKSFPNNSISAHSSATTLLERQAVVVDIQRTTRNICIIKIKLHDQRNPFSYRGGQFINIWKDPDVIRSYSIASPDNEDVLELHVRRHADGKFSEWAYSELSIGEKLNIQGPRGTCYYAEDCKQKPLQLYAIGTGLAPILGVLRTALSEGHSQQINLVAGAKDAGDLYYVDELVKLAKDNDNLDVSCVAMEGVIDDASQVKTVLTDFYSYATDKEIFNPKAMTFVCGNESFVTKLRRRCFMAGADLSNIRADIFLRAASA